MVSVSPAGLRSLAAENTLQLFQGQQPTKTAATTVVPTVETTSKNRLATIAGLIDKLIDIKSGGTGEASASAIASNGSTPEKRAATRMAFEAAKANEDTARRAALRDDVHAWFDSVAGSGQWVLRNRPPADVEGDIAELRQLLDANLNEADVDNSYERGYVQALREGSLKIVPSSEVPEFGFEYIMMDIYYDDGGRGGAGTSVANFDYLKQQAQQGIHIAGNTINGHDYVLIWNASAEEKETGIWFA